jgi:hypothetical protein
MRLDGFVGALRLRERAGEDDLGTDGAWKVDNVDLSLSFVLDDDGGDWATCSCSCCEAILPARVDSIATLNQPYNLDRFDLEQQLQALFSFLLRAARSFIESMSRQSRNDSLRPPEDIPQCFEC